MSEMLCCACYAMLWYAVLHYAILHHDILHWDAESYKQIMQTKVSWVMMAFLKHQTSTETFWAFIQFGDKYCWPKFHWEIFQLFKKNEIEENSVRLTPSNPVPIYLRPPMSTYSGLLRIMSTLSVSFMLASFFGLVQLGRIMYTAYDWCDHYHECSHHKTCPIRISISRIFSQSLIITRVMRGMLI